MALNEQLRVQVGRDAGRGLEITPHEITGEGGYREPQFAPPGDPFVWLRLYPPVLATLRASIGSVTSHGVRAQQITGESVVFAGSAEASTQHLVHSGLIVDVQGMAFDADGQPLSVSITADDEGLLKASQPFYGAAVVSYTTQYRLLKYRYEVTQSNPDSFGPGTTTIAAGTVLAFHDGQVATYEVPAAQAPQSEPNTGEVYRDVSYAILQDGEGYERPPNWPDETWPDGSPDPDETWVETERVHAIGRMESFCRLAVDREYIAPAAPHVDSNNYEIPIERIIASDDSLIGQGFGSSCVARAKAQIPAAKG